MAQKSAKPVQIAARVSSSVKSEVVGLAKIKGWTESKTVTNLVEAGLAANLAESFSVLLKKTCRRP